MKQPEKICVICGNKFKQWKSTQRVCGMQCSIKHQNQKKKNAVKKKAIKQPHEIGALTASDWKQKLVTVFNRYIRLRDLNKGCVSCDATFINKKYDAGHFWASTYEGIRFHEWNVHGQCITCNRLKGSNNAEYRKRITNRITPEQLQWLDDNRHIELKLTIPEIKRAIDHYEYQIKLLENAY